MLLAAESPVDLVQFGVLGVIVTLILFGWLWAKPAVDRLAKDKERAEAQRDALIDVYQREVIPALRDATVSASRMAATIGENSEVLAEVRAHLSVRRPRG